MTQPAPDERRVRHLLVSNGVGPDADEQLPALPPSDDLPPGYAPAEEDAWSWAAYFNGVSPIE